MLKFYDHHISSQLNVRLSFIRMTASSLIALRIPVTYPRNTETASSGVCLAKLSIKRLLQFPKEMRRRWSILMQKISNLLFHQRKSEMYIHTLLCLIVVDRSHYYKINLNWHTHVSNLMEAANQILSFPVRSSTPFHEDFLQLLSTSLIGIIDNPELTDSLPILSESRKPLRVLSLFPKKSLILSHRQYLLVVNLPPILQSLGPE